jgi:hypothetical protein
MSQRIYQQSRGEHTHVDGDLVASLNKLILIIAAVQLCKRRETSRAHPVVEVFISA